MCDEWIVCREKRAEIREYKKKKAAKKKEKMNEVEEFREHEKGRWKSFSQKVPVIVMTPPPTCSLLPPTVFKVPEWSIKCQTEEEHLCSP